MNIDIVSATERPVDVISLAAGTCYGKDDISNKRVETCYKSGHLSVFEHASVTVKASGISRACSHQLVRHRLASFSQQSQRYCKINTDGYFWYVIPPEIESSDELLERFNALMRECAKEYKDALSSGMRPEDARYLLPEATKTEITFTMNVRELFHFLDLRQSKASQWEIRNLANVMEQAVKEYNDQWSFLIDLRADN